MPELKKPNNLVDAQIDCHWAQIQYYQKKATESAPSLARAWLQPAQLIAFIGVAIALVATIWSNVQTSASRTQASEQAKADREEIAFHRALERMGDDSSVVRVGAALLIAEMAEQDKFYHAAMFQLLYGFMEEDNPVALRAIQDGLVELVLEQKGAKKTELVTRLIQLKNKLEGDILEPLAAVMLNPDGSSSAIEDIAAKRWLRAESLAPQTRFKEADFRSFVKGREREFTSYQAIAEWRHQVVPTGEEAVAMTELISQFQAAATRLRLVKTLLGEEPTGESLPKTTQPSS